MHHYVYLIENVLNGKIYVGKHSTQDLDDGYMGSGKLLTRAISKYGVENFRKNIIAMFDSEAEALQLESEIVDEEFVQRVDTYNMTEGGLGGWQAFNKHADPTHQRDVRSRGGKASWKKMRSDPTTNAALEAMLAKGRKSAHERGSCHFPDWTGRRHTEESKRKIGQANAIRQRGEGNSQFGTVWVSHLEQRVSKRISKGELQSYLQLGWVRGRKMKW